MNETLFIYSPVTLTLSLVAIILASSFSTMLGQKIKVSRLPFAVRRLVYTIVLWNIFCLIGTIFFSGDHPGIGGQIVFGLQALTWIQAGNIIYRVAQVNLRSKTFPLWNIFNLIGIVITAALTVVLCVSPSTVTSLSLFEHPPFSGHPNFVLYGTIFFIFVFPELLRSIYVLLRNALQTSNLAQSQISIYDGRSLLLCHHTIAL